MKDALPCFLVFAGRDNHSRIWNGDSDAGNDLGKSIVVDSVVKLIGIDIVGVFQTRNADRVRTDSECRFQMLGMHEKPGKFIAVFVQAEEYPQSDVVYAAFHGAVHRFGVIVVVVFWSGRMQFKIAFFMVCFLKQDVRSDAGFFEQAVIIDCRSRNINIDTADRAVFMFDAVNRFDRF